MNPLHRFCNLQNRRQFITHTSMGLGMAALANALHGQAGGAVLHHRAKAKRVIFLFMAGGPSQLDLFDFKPDLHLQQGKPLPKSISNGQRVTAMTIGQAQVTFASPFKFSKWGETGLWWSELLPHMSTVIDELCVIKSTNTQSINHDPGQTLVCTGSELPGKPSMGAWIPHSFRRPRTTCRRYTAACGVRAFCRRNTRERRSSPAAILCCFFQVRRASTATCDASRSTS